MNKPPGFSKPSNIRSESGIPFLHAVGYYTLNHVPEGEVLRESEWAAAYDPASHTAEKFRSSIDELTEEEEGPWRYVMSQEFLWRTGDRDVILLG